MPTANRGERASVSADPIGAGGPFEIRECERMRRQCLLFMMGLMLFGLLCVGSRHLFGGGFRTGLLVIVGWIAIVFSSWASARFWRMWRSGSPLLQVTARGVTLRDYPELGTLAWDVVCGASIHRQQYRMSPLVPAGKVAMLRIDVRDYDRCYRKFDLWNRFIHRLGIPERAIIISVNAAEGDAEKGASAINEWLKARVRPSED